ncbi:MAG TPA: hypothetical protein PLZ51_25735, partial [Aggregatilineales bacterium]|nr:hypothetical protein [Aggregatilineales bacterium]
NISDFRFSPNGDYLAGISKMGSIYVWDGNNGNLIDKIEATDKSHLSHLVYYSLCWSPTNDYLVAQTTHLSPIVWKFDGRLHFIFDATMNYPDDTS